MQYPLYIHRDGHSGFRASFPDFPNAGASGDSFGELTRTITDRGDRVADPTDKECGTRWQASTRLNSTAYSHGLVSQPVAVCSVALQDFPAHWEVTMRLDYKDFHIDASPLDEGGHYYARAKIYRRASVGGDTAEVKWSGDLGDYPSDATAIEAAQRWAIRWCDENSV
jgi:hypothetical protein